MRTMRICALLAAAALWAAALPAAPPPTSAPAPANGTASPSARLAKIHERITLMKLPLEKVLAQYARLSGLKIQAEWGALGAAGIKKTTPVTLKTYRLSFEKILTLTLGSIAPRRHPLSWVLSGDTVTISTERRVLPRDELLAPAIRPGRGRPRPRAGESRGIHFDRTKLHMVTEFLRDLTRLNMHVNWRALEMSGITKDTPVTLKVRGVSTRRVLDLLTSQLSGTQDVYGSVYWYVDETVVHISTGTALNQTTKTRSFDVADLLVAIPNFKGPRIRLDNNSSNTSGSGTDRNNNANDLFKPIDDDTRSTRSTGSGKEMTRKEREEQLINVIKDAIGEEMWRPTGKGSIRILRGKMIITQTSLGFKLLEKSLIR